MIIVPSIVVGAVCTYFLSQVFPHWFFCVSKLEHRDTLTTLRETQTRADSLLNRALMAEEIMERRAKAIERLSDEADKARVTVAALRTQVQNLLDSREASQPPRGTWEAAARELQRRIDAFRRQSQRVKKAYCEDVFRISHGQVDKQALIDPEKYLVETSEGQYKTAGDIIRECEEFGRLLSDKCGSQ